MSNILKFKPSSIEKAEHDFKNTHLDANQKKIIQSFSQILSQYLHISDRAIKGFFWRVVKDYQEKYQFNMSEDVKIKTPAERIEALNEMFTMLKKELTRILIDQEQEPLLDEALKNAMSLYKSRFANR